MNNKHLGWLTLIVSTVSALLFAGTSHAASTNIMPPFDIGSTWYVCQGYNGPVTHAGNDAYALDFTKQLCDGTTATNEASAGENVRSPTNGIVYWYSNAYGAVCINTSDNRSVELVHIDSKLSSGELITAGQLVGTIAVPGARMNNGFSHLHLQMWSAPNCAADTPITFDAAHTARICGAPDMAATGPDLYNNGAWSGTHFTAQSCTHIQPKPAGSIYRFWSDSKMHHFYTADYAEAQHVADTWPDVWSYESSANFQVSPLTADGTCPTATQPVYRFWSDRYQGHFYTIDPEEKTRVSTVWPDVWHYERVAYCASAAATLDYSSPVYRFWSDRYMGHFYTTDAAERDRVIATWPDVWHYEGIAYYVKK